MAEPVSLRNRVFFFGCWNQAGHFSWAPGGEYVRRADAIEHYGGDRIHLDGTLAPRKMKTYYGGGLCWQGQGATQDKRNRIGYDSEEYPQGQFLRHDLDNGFTAIQWWDRCQGDTRSACNSTLLLEGKHTSEEMLAALKEHFPHIIKNLEQNGISLVEVQKA